METYIEKDMIQECFFCGKIDTEKRWFGIKPCDEKNFIVPGSKMQRAHEECLDRANMELVGNLFDGNH